MRTTRFYTLKGISRNPEHANTPQRWIQVGRSGNPILCTRLQYSWYRTILFETEEEAKIFAFNFSNSDNRREDYNVKWEVIPYKTETAHNKFFDINSEYGRMLTRTWNVKGTFNPVMITD